MELPDIAILDGLVLAPIILALIAVQFGVIFGGKNLSFHFSLWVSLIAIIIAAITAAIKLFQGIYFRDLLILFSGPVIFLQVLGLCGLYVLKQLFGVLILGFTVVFALYQWITLGEPHLLPAFQWSIDFILTADSNSFFVVTYAAVVLGTSSLGLVFEGLAFTSND